MASPPEIWVGIDVGKTAHHACAVDETGKTVFSQKFGNNQVAVESLIARAGQTADRVRWAIDLTSPLALLLITVLLAADQAVTYVPGRVVNTMTHGFRGEAKTDAKDAKVIAETARMRGDLSQVTMPDELVVGLTRLTSYRTDLMSDWVAGINRLRSLSVRSSLRWRPRSTTRTEPRWSSSLVCAPRLRSVTPEQLVSQHI